MKDLAFYDTGDCALDDFARATGRSTDRADVPRAARIASEVPIYAARDLPIGDPAGRRAVLAEWARVLRNGAGVLVIEGAVPDTGALDDATAVHEAIIADERAASGAKADHFAAAGANDRIWNALQKLCLRAPATFARYFGSPAIDAVCEAWLGPGYQVTAQVNLVRPGGKAQTAHRDYHLGFQTGEEATRFPAHVHELSPFLTLQGAVAHCDMPVESGPTKLLPFSQGYGPGYMAYRRPDFAEFFEARCIQLPLARGDAVFFSPALFHAAGENRSASIHRMANLLQVSSAMGRAMESVDRLAMSKALYPALQSLDLPGDRARAAIAACAEGYSFPTNLDTDPPAGGLAPETQAALMTRALAAGMPAADLNAALDAQAARRAP
ncbi:phytanoyl-CoA dioxygenase [Rhodobacterales bacterium HKCCE2091]|nr:phytanoyl-CoA dioxygenase [Rhodobacterales bacterium HKCCE2091]